MRPRRNASLTDGMAPDSDPARIVFHSLSASRFLAFAQRLGAGRASPLHSSGHPPWPKAQFRSMKPCRSRMVAMNPSNPSLDDLVAVLERTPTSLAALLEGLPATWVAATEGDNTWSPCDVIGHLIYGERVNWIPRARHILAGETRPFDPFDRTAQFTQSRGKQLSELLTTFKSLRRDNIASLVELNLTNADLERVGLHPELGKITLAQLLATWAVHDLDHLGQIARTMAKVCTSAVGPWVNYLSILKDRQH